MEVKLEEKTPGIRFNKKGEAEVCVWAPLKKSAAIILADELKLPLTKDNSVYWTASTNKIKPGDLYKVLLESEKHQ